MSFFSHVFVFISFLLCGAYAYCPPVSGDFTLNVTDLFPESADWDSVGCKLYISSLYNVTLVTYDPYTNETEIIQLPGLSNPTPGDFANAAYHGAGVDFDIRTRSIYTSAVGANSFTGFQTGNYSNANYTGPNNVVRYDTANQAIAYDTSLQPARDAFTAQLGNLSDGYQDIAEVPSGDLFAIGTFGSAIAKVTPDADVSLYYARAPYNETFGFGGVFAVGSKLVISDTISRGFVTFDTTSATPEPVFVTPTSVPENYTTFLADGLTNPGRYGGKIALWSDDFVGTVVYGSKDEWASAQFLGLVPNPYASQNGFPTDTFEMGGSIYVVTEFFQLQGFVTKSDFPFYDITGQVDSIAASFLA